MKNFGTYRPKHHKAKCSWKDCLGGEALNVAGVCSLSGMWWHPSCPCWELSDMDDLLDFETFVFEQRVKDNLLNLYKWINPDTPVIANKIVDGAFAEFKALLKAMWVSRRIPPKTILSIMGKDKNIDLMMLLLLLKLSLVNSILADLIEREYE